MAHVIEILRDNEAEARSFLDALFYSDFVLPVGHRADGEKTKTIAINCEGDEESELDERISNLITDGLDAGESLDEIEAYCRISPETVFYQPEFTNIKQL